MPQLPLFLGIASYMGSSALIIEGLDQIARLLSTRIFFLVSERFGASVGAVCFSMNPNNYRPEIEGLRAVAVLAVVLFHVKPDWLKGGFVGVDVFFVISGFLITSIVLRQSQAGTFSFKDFWLRRVRRLFPALGVVLVCTLVAGYFTLIGDEWTSLGSQVASVILLVGNIQMWQLANDYWGQTAQDTPLLHTWSLAVEEQFYLLYPLALVLLLKLGRRYVALVLFAGLAGSFAISLYGTSRMPAATFYLLPSRAWELLIGCLLAVAKTRLPVLRTSSLLAFTGLALVMASCLLIDGASGFPGVKALVPTVGAALILAFAQGGDRACLTTRLLSHPVCTYIGRISYSLYLWHWPVIVFAHWYGVHLIWIIGASFALAIISYHFVETPLRHNVRLQWYLPVAGLLIFAAALPVSFRKFEPRGLPGALASIDAPIVTTRGQEFEARFLIEKGGVLLNCEADKMPELVLLGSSHARVFGRSFADYAESSGKAVSLLGCTHLGVSDIDSMEARARLEWLEKWRPSVIVLAGRWELEIVENPGFEEDLRTVLARVASWNPQCIVLGQVPLLKTDEYSGKNLRKFLITEYRRTGEVPRIEVDPAVHEANERVRGVVAALQLPGLRYVDTSMSFRQDDDRVHAVQDGVLLYSDQDHLNDAGAAIVFEQCIRPLLTQLRRR
ncbi:MAG: acyltransferase family protein [Verrucomicrobiales bacterium]